MRVLVCGSREFENQNFLEDVLYRIHEDRPVTTVISGAARGADNLGELWAASNDIPIILYPANWKRYGKQAGPIRNRQMLMNGRPDLVVAFKVIDVKSHGTNHMIAIAKAQGVEVEEHYAHNVANI